MEAKNQEKNRENDVPMIPKHQAESVMMYMSWALRNMAIVAVAAFVAIVAAVIIFVNGYTSRTKDWLNTYAQLRNQTAVTEVADGGIQQQPTP